MTPYEENDSQGVDDLMDHDYPRASFLVCRIIFPCMPDYFWL
jgi:hypothetical protein